tara:strand:+ start:965 stop:1075 length:111 start_codon:yes stop_codon:yes gene_type:complete
MVPRERSLVLFQLENGNNIGTSSRADTGDLGFVVVL